MARRSRVRPDRRLLRFRKSDRTFRASPPAGDFRPHLFVVHDRLLLHRKGGGLHEFADEARMRLPRAPATTGRAGAAVLPAAGGRLLVALGQRGLFLLDPAAPAAPLSRFSTEAEAILERTQLLAAMRRHDGAHARGTATEGVVLLAAAGRLLRHLTRESGLPNVAVISLCEDREGGLWVGTISKGLFLAACPPGAATDRDGRDATVTRFTSAAGLPEGHGAIYLSATSLGTLFDTADGIFHFDSATGRLVAFRQISAFATRRGKPLIGVIGYAQVLVQDRELFARNHKRRRVVQAGVEHLVRIINEELDCSKIEAGRMELQTASFHLPSCCATASPRSSPAPSRNNSSCSSMPRPSRPTSSSATP